MKITNSFFAGVLALATTPASANLMPAQQLCLDQRIRKAAAQAVGAWAQKYPFTKVLIGDDGQFGDVGPPRSTDQNADWVICHSRFNLVRVAKSGHPYAVAIEEFDYRITETDDGYTVSLENLPAETTNAAEANALIDRFTVDGRPYRDILAENHARLSGDERR